MKKAVFLAVIPMLLLAGCGSKPKLSKQTADLSADFAIHSTDGSTVTKTDDFVSAQYHFTLSMLQSAVKRYESENLALTPVTAAQCIAAVGSGAAGDTRTEIENAFGGMDLNVLNEQLLGWNSHRSAEQLQSAASVWVQADTDFHLEKDFAGGCADFFSAPFDDSTLSDINTWVSERTGGTIPKIIEEFEPNEVFDLIGVLNFDAKWDAPYADNEVITGCFHDVNGKDQTAKYMKKHMEDATYLSDGNQAVGVMRDYEGHRYAFGALMPVDAPLADYIGSLTPESLRKIINSGKQTQIDSLIPQFTMEQTLDLMPVMMDMGIQTAYDMSNADFSGMTSEQLWLTRTTQEAYVQVDRHGTKASFALDLGGEVSAESEYHVSLNNPFVWFIYDTQYGLPVMIGTVQTLES